MEKLRSVLVGLGARASDYYVPAIQSSQLSKLVAVCDVDNKKVSHYQSLFSIKGYQDYEELIEEEEIDLVIAVLPHHLYRDLINCAANKGIHVLKEKPFAVNLSEAMFITKICCDYDIKLMTTLQRRLNPVYQTFFDYLPKIGRPFHLEGKYSFFIDNLAEGWRAEKKLAGGGCILDMGYHLIDLIIWYFGVPNLVHAEFSNCAIDGGNYDVEDTATIMFSYQTGLHGTLSISRYRPPKTEWLEIRGSQGTIYITPSEIKLLNRQGDLIKCLKDSQSSDNQIDYFCDVITGNKTNFASPEYHLQHLQFIDACYDSKKKQAYVSPQEVIPQCPN